ncbi:MAG: hypothetical protein NPIRA03_11560 [Nitrospirales bacterium]|nr:MAG: hypothetical protein NPIRA03_11560 [Nitrospirales bacterium]
MKNIMTMMGLSAFLVLSSVGVFADQTNMTRQDDQSNDPGMGSSIESKSPSSQNTEPMESEEQKAARPGGVGEEGSSFGSPSSLPPGETSPGYTGEDKKAEEMEKRRQGM